MRLMGHIPEFYWQQIDLYGGWFGSVAVALATEKTAHNSLQNVVSSLCLHTNTESEVSEPQNKCSTNVQDEGQLHWIWIVYWWEK